MIHPLLLVAVCLLSLTRAMPTSIATQAGQRTLATLNVTGRPWARLVRDVLPFNAYPAYQELFAVNLEVAMRSLRAQRNPCLGLVDAGWRTLKAMASSHVRDAFVSMRSDVAARHFMGQCPGVPMDRDTLQILRLVAHFRRMERMQPSF